MKLPLTPPRSRSVDVLTVGENSLDLVAELDGFPAPDGKYELLGFRHLPGGEAASAAAGLARLGASVAYVGRFGDDQFAAIGRQHLAAEGVDLSYVRTVAGVSSRLAIVLVDRRDGRRTVLWQRDPALALQPDDVPQNVMAKGRVVLVGSDDVGAMTAAAHRARQLGTRTVGDLERIHPGTDTLLRQLDVIIMAATFPGRFTGYADLGKALHEIAAQSGAALLVATLGEDGCLALCGGYELRVPAFRVDVVDTTGAGDLFRAGFISRWCQSSADADIVDLLRYASAVAGLNCRATGAWTGAPTAAEVDQLMKAQPYSSALV